MRRVVTARVRGQTVVTVCRADERLVGWYARGGFATAAPPAPAVVARAVHEDDGVPQRRRRRRRAGRGQGIVQLAAICAGGT